MSADDVHVTVAGSQALTVEQLADRYGMTVAAVEKLINRGGIPPVAKIGRVYDPARVDAEKAARPGKGGPGQPRPHKPPRKTG